MSPYIALSAALSIKDMFPATSPVFCVTVISTSVFIARVSSAHFRHILIGFYVFY